MIDLADCINEGVLEALGSGGLSVNELGTRIVADEKSTSREAGKQALA
jgi:hypothetical protein